ncbi:MAG TPA: hypothetical protein VIY48_14170 [Candidatus Paceibacterota bacterium]
MEVTTMRLGHGIDITTVRAFVFAEMLKRAQEVTKHYACDLYHDALFLYYVGFSDDADGDVRFYYQPREIGTTITRHMDVVLCFDAAFPVYRFNVSKKGRNYTLTIEKSE